MTSSFAVSPEWKVITIGRGSFAVVSILAGRPVVFKHVIFSTRTPELKNEFEVLCALYDSGFCKGDLFFSIPCPFAYYDPEIATSYVYSDRLPVQYNSKSAQMRGPLVSKADFRALNLDTAAYAMEHVLPLPISTALAIRKLFYPPGQEEATLPSLCRLYFGKVIDGGRPNRFFSSANFQLDVSRYNQLRASAGPDIIYYPSVDEISRGMGEMLGRLHWQGGYDARDIEFVMGGASFSGIAMHVIDFNQMRSWSKTIDDIPQLVDAFLVNDPYYPRPRAEDSLYQQFCFSYMSAYSEENVDIAKAFLRGISGKQAKRGEKYWD